MIGLLKKLVLLSVLLVTNAYAATPIWTFQPLTATTISISSSQTATVQYIVTNQSVKNHVLMLRATNGITQITSPGRCGPSFTLESKQSCVLSLQVNGGALTSNVVGGPVVCEQRDPLQCYQPSKDNQLNITYSG